DVNGDGYDDVLVGARGADPRGSYSGSSYLVFGGAGGFASNLDLSALDGTNGFQISGEDELHQSGHSLSGAGDVNGDGIADYVVGAWGADDHGVDTGAAYVVFGRTGGYASDFDLSALNGVNGFQFIGEASDDFAGFSAVSGAGDVNGDGYDDVLVGAFGSDEHGADAGAAYVIYGAAGGFGASLELSALDGFNGFQVSGGSAADYAGRSVSGAGDVNGDGYSDLVIGAPKTDFAGTDSGAGYVVFGGDFNGAAHFLGGAGANRFTGTAAAERFVGGGGNDFMIGGGGADVFRGGAGNDTVRMNRAAFADIDGGSGSDTLALNGGIDLDLTAIANSRISGIETINLGVGAGASDLTLSRGDLLDLSDTSNTLKVQGAADDSVTVTDGTWTDTGVAGDFHVYTLGAARLEIKTAITDVTIALVD
ncbi:MAG: hypothetical protein QOD26_1708, partial [Betaproteobacteria bacterium]|nr:hypothetical protein [Betaproteobacteria bacterium]